MHPPPKKQESRMRDKRSVSFQNEHENTAQYWNDLAQDTLIKHLQKRLIKNVAKNVIFFLGDGMSIPTLAASRIYFGQKNGALGEETKLSFEEFPFIGLSKVNRLILCC